MLVPSLNNEYTLQECYYAKQKQAHWFTTKLANDKVLHMHLLFIWKKLSILTCHLEFPKKTSKITINYNTLIKVQVSYITVVSDHSKTHSERPACINDSERYYIVFGLSG